MMWRILAAWVVLFAVSWGQLAVRGEIVYPVSKPPIKNGVVLIEGGKIKAVGPANEIPIPEGWHVEQAKVVTPGLIDAHSVVGLAGIYNRNQDQDQLEGSAPIQPELRALDSFNISEPLVTWLREHGITTVHTGHAPAALISGQSLITKTCTGPSDERILRLDAMVLATLGDGARASGSKSPGTPAKMLAMLRQALIEARDHDTKSQAADEDKKPKRDLRNEALARVLQGKAPLLVTVHRDRDIRSALRLAEEFKIKLVLDGASEIYLCMDAVKASGVPVILHPPMARAGGERKNASFETGAQLKKAGILFTYQSGYESYVPKTRVVLFEAGIAAAHGLGLEGALAAITLDAARILGIDDRVGSLEVGKDADMALFDGDPFEYTSHVLMVICDGKVVSSIRR